MQTTVERILEGDFKDTRIPLEFSEEAVDVSLREGETREKSFSVLAGAGAMPEGKVFSDSLYVSFPEPSFSGTDMEIPYQIDTKGLAAGDVVKGSFAVISNCGEYRIPYTIRVKGDLSAAGSDRFTGLMQFVNFARTDFKAAGEAFKEEDFASLLQGTDAAYLSLYELLKDAPDHAQALEEFLVAAGKKQRVKFLVEHPEVSVDITQAASTRHLTVSRNGWGYSRFEITTDAEFLSLLKDSVDEEDFSGNTVRIPYRINEEFLHGGKNYGRIILKNPYTELSATIVVIRHPVNARLREIRRKNSHLLVDLMHYYIAFRTKKVSARSWKDETEKLLSKMMDNDPEELSYRLMHVHVLITMERFHEAKWILEEEKGRAEGASDPSIYAYYRYLYALVTRSPEETEKSFALVERLYRQDPSDWRIAWILLYLSGDLSLSAEKKWDFLKSLSSKGAATPVLYVEGGLLLSSNATVLTVLGNFELRLLRFMVKYSLLTPGVVEQLLYLFERQKTYPKALLPLLLDCYLTMPDDRLLAACVTLLISYDIRSMDAFMFYEEAVKRNLNVARLYEYYLMSMDLRIDREIPRNVLLYFSYDMPADTLRTAFLYAWVQKRKSEQPELYEHYRDAILKFVLTSAENGENNRFLAYLYKEVLEGIMIREEQAEGLLTAVFLNRVTTQAQGIRKAYVRYDPLSETFAYPAKEEDFFLPVYGKGRIVLEDEKGFRFAGDDLFTVKALSAPERFSEYLLPYAGDSLPFAAYYCNINGEFRPATDENLKLWRFLRVHPKVSGKIKKKISMMLLSFYYEENRTQDLQMFLEELAPSDISGEDRGNVIRLLAMRGLYDKAYRWITEGGDENTDPKVLSRVLSRILSERMPDNPLSDSARPESLSERPEFLILAWHVFARGKQDDAILPYLVRNYRGLLDDMIELYEAAGKDRNRHYLAEKILMQSLYTGYLPEKTGIIFSEYVKDAGKTRLSQAFASRIAFDHFVKEKDPGKAFRKDFALLFREGDTVPLVCKLSYTKLCSSQIRDLTESESRRVIAYLKEILQKGMYFSYFRAYSDSFAFMRRFSDRTIIEYRTSPGSHVMINYMYENGTRSAQGYRKESLRDMYHGIFVKQFVLFYGETMQYYITDGEDAEERTAGSGTLSRADDIPTGAKRGGSRYGMLNDIAVSHALTETERTEELMRQYYLYDHLVETIIYDHG